jgi:hypothetical protein
VGIEVVPPLAAPGQRVLTEALARAGVQTDGAPSAYASAWRTAGLHEAAAPDEPEGYALSPRSTRGATRA